MKRGKVNPSHETMCCLSCGRDTQSSYGLCCRCSGRGSFGGTQGVPESKDRPVLQIDGDPSYKYESEDNDDVDNS